MKTRHFLASFRNFQIPLIVRAFRECRSFVRYLYGEWRGDIVTLAQSLQSLEVVHGLKKLTVNRRLIAQDS